MPGHRSSSLSFAEPHQALLLQGWIELALSEALSAAKSRDAPLLHVSTLKLRAGLPLCAFDSSIRDAFLFGHRDRVVVGVGAAKVLEPSLSKGASAVTKRSLLASALSNVDASDVVVMGGWGFAPASTPRRA